MSRVPLTLSRSTVTFSVGTLYEIPFSAANTISLGFFTDFPAPWASVSPDPGVEISVTNNSTSAPIAPILLDKWVSGIDGLTYYYPIAELSTVQPGATVDETVACMPTTTMRLVLMYLGVNLTDVASGWTANVAAWAV